MRRSLTVCALCLAIASIARPSLAQAQSSAFVPPLSPPPLLDAGPTPSPRAEWYGMETLLVDGIGLASGLTLYAMRSPQNRPSALAWMDIGIHNVGLIGAPAVHMAHRRGTWGMASLTTRVFMPPITSLFGALSTCLSSGTFNRECTESGMAGGFLVGAIGASALDAFVYANPTELSAPAPASWYGWQTLAVDVGGALFGASLYLDALNRGTAYGSALIGPEFFFAVGIYAVGAVGGPIVHLFHRKWGRAFGDFAMRVFVPAMWVGISMLGNCAATSAMTGCADRSLSPGLLLGTLAVATFDAAGLGWDEDDPASAQTFSLFPSVSVREGQPLVGLGGVF